MLLKKTSFKNLISGNVYKFSQKIIALKYMINLLLQDFSKIFVIYTIFLIKKKG